MARDFETAGSSGTLKMRPTPAIDYREGARSYWAFSEYDRSEGRVERVNDRLAPECATWFAPRKAD